MIEEKSRVKYPWSVVTPFTVFVNVNVVEGVHPAPSAIINGGAFCFMQICMKSFMLCAQYYPHAAISVHAHHKIHK